MDDLFSELTPSLTVIAYSINVTDLDYIKLGERFEPTKNVVAINSNFIHKAFDGYDQFLSKPKVKRTRKNDTLEKATSKPNKRRPGDHTTFNACIEFTIIVDDMENTKTVRYFPRSGAIQIFSAINPIDIFIRYLSECGLAEFSSVELIGEGKTLLSNYKFSINLGEYSFINLSNLYHALEEDDSVKDMVPFPIHFIKCDAGDIHSKIAIVFTSKIRVHIWPKSGKVNIFGTKTELSASLIRGFIQDVFYTKWDSLVCGAPTTSSV